MIRLHPILSFHIADVGVRVAPRILRAAPNPTEIPGLRYAETAITAALGRRLPSPRPGRVAMIAAWDDDAAVDAFLADHPLAAPLAGGWQVRLEPLRIYGAWSGLPDLPDQELPVDPDEPVAVLTLGRLRLSRAVPFFRASARAERQAVTDPALLAATGLARPPRLVSTFSLWRTAREMRAYAVGDADAGHPRALRANRAEPFHHEQAFVRLRPYASHGSWDGRDPLAGATTGTGRMSDCALGVQAPSSLAGTETPVSTT